jgi:hypothetical protein
MKTPSSLLRTAKQASCAMFACLDQQRAIRFPLPPATMAGRVSSFYLRHIYSHAFVFALDKHAVGFLSVQIEIYIVVNIKWEQGNNGRFPMSFFFLLNY